MNSIPYSSIVVSGDDAFDFLQAQLAADLNNLHGRAPSPDRHIGWRERWSTTAREQRLFPMLAVLTSDTQHTQATSQSTQQEEQKPTAPIHEIARWEVHSINQRTFGDQQQELFEVPDDYHRTEPSRF